VGKTNALAKSEVYQWSRAWVTNGGWSSLGYTILLEDLLGIKKCRQKHAAALTPFPWQLVRSLHGNCHWPTTILSFKQSSAPPVFTQIFRFSVVFELENLFPRTLLIIIIIIAEKSVEQTYKAIRSWLRDLSSQPLFAGGHTSCYTSKRDDEFRDST
jgi:hypothetical protein